MKPLLKIKSIGSDELNYAMDTNYISDTCMLLSIIMLIAEAFNFRIYFRRVILKFP